MEELIVEENGAFKKVLDLFKRGWKRVLGYCIICVIIVTLLLSLVGIIFSQKSFQTSVTFNNDYIMKGMSPWNSSFDINSIAKSSSVVTNALKQCGYNDDEIAEMRDFVTVNLSVIKGETMLNSKEEEYAYVFKINLNKNKELQLSTAQYIALTDAITIQTIDAIKSKYTYSITYCEPKSIDYTTTNFVKAYDLLNASLNELTITTNEMASLAPSFRSTVTGQTFANLNAALQSTKIELDSLQAYLMETPVTCTTNNGAAEKAYITQKVTSLTNSTESLKTRIDEFAEIIKTIKPEIIVGSTSLIATTIENEEYYNLVKEYNELQIEYLRKSEEKSVWESLNTAYAGVILSTEDSNQFVKTMADGVQQDLTAIYNDAISNVNEYNDVELLKNCIKITSPSQNIEEKAIGTMLFVIIEFVMIVLAIGLALIVTNKKTKSGIDNKNTAKAKE